MPSVEMRRSTRVFVPKAKDVEFVRVLRSGRRLRVESDDKWFDSLVDTKKSKQQNGGGQPYDVEPVNAVRSGERVVKYVYSRKRKRTGGSELGSVLKVEAKKRKFGLHFVRRHKRKSDNDRSGLLCIVVTPPSCSVLASILVLILEHMTRKCVSVVHLSAFLGSHPISSTFASLGIRSFRGLPSTSRRGLCQIFGAKQLTPLFTVDFSAVPLCFVQLHTSICFRMVRLSCSFWMDYCGKSESDSDSDSDFHDSPPSVADVQGDLPLSKVVVCNDPKVTEAVNSSSVVGKTGSRSLHYRVGVITRSRSKRRHRSLRPRRARSLSVFDQHRGIVSSPSHYLSHRKSPLLSGCNQGLRKPASKTCAIDTPLPKLSSNALTSNVDVDTLSCSASILVTETEMCYRVEAAEVKLDMYDSNEWVLSVKKDGSTRYCFKAQYEMRPCATNRVTHAVIWTGENGWKLEFPNRNDWSIFKELYKACAERNAGLPSPTAKIIPVPGVREVTNAWDSCGGTFERPNSYIRRMTSDELSMALARRSANYDMDSEDEEWVGNLNSKCDATDELLENTFELMMDAFEKASFCNSEDCSNEKAAANLCSDLASSDVVEEVYGYWMKKRSRKNRPLLLVYQLNESKRALLISEPVLRKKRSFKRQASHLSQRGRGKDTSVLQAIAVEQSAADDQNAILKAEEAKTSANKSMEMAINKRKWAQSLMENADWAVFRATMALRIAEAAQTAEAHQAAAHFLD